MATAITTTGGATIAQIEAGDTLTITFSEPLNPAAVPNIVIVTETDPAGAGFDTLTIPGITNGNLSTGSDSYIPNDNTGAGFASSTVALTNANTTTTITITVGGALGRNLTATAFIFAPAAALTDPNANAATGTLTATIRLF